MGTLLDLIRRLFGARDQESPPASLPLEPESVAPVEWVGPTPDVVGPPPPLLLAPEPEPVPEAPVEPVAQPGPAPEPVASDPLPAEPRSEFESEPEPVAMRVAASIPPDLDPRPVAVVPPAALVIEPAAETRSPAPDVVPLTPDTIELATTLVKPEPGSPATVVPAGELASAAVVVPTPSEARPQPLGMVSELAWPLFGGEAGPAPTLQEWFDDLRSRPDSPLRTPEAVARRQWSDRRLMTLGYLTAEQFAALPGLPDPAAAPEPLPLAEQRANRRAAALRERAERGAALAFRHATEITFLGRGVSAALSHRAGDAAALARLGLPQLDSPAELAERLAISVGRLRWLAWHAEVATRVHYVGFDIAKKGGGTRRLSAPHRSLALAQRWIWTEVVAKLPTEDAAHGFVPGRSIVTNARCHAGRAVVVNMDLAGFFPSIRLERIRSVFEHLGYSPALATILGLLCTEAPRRTVTYDGTILHVATGPRGLPQGACTSPGLSNQVARRLDRRLAGLAGKLGATYTRYADDLTFSGPAGLDPRVGYLMAQVRRIATSEGFTVNEAKSRVLRPNRAQVVTGLVVNDRPGVPRAEVRQLRAILHRAKLEGLAAQNHANRPDFRSWLMGKIAFVAMARPDVGARLLADYRALGAP